MNYATAIQLLGIGITALLAVTNRATAVRVVDSIRERLVAEEAAPSVEDLQALMAAVEADVDA